MYYVLDSNGVLYPALVLRFWVQRFVRQALTFDRERYLDFGFHITILFFIDSADSFFFIMFITTTTNICHQWTSDNT